MPSKGLQPEAGVGLASKPINVIKIEEDILDDKRPGLVPLFTDLKDLPPLKPRQRRTETIDKSRYNEFECGLEDQFYQRIRLPVERQTIV